MLKGTHYPDNVLQYIHHYHQSYMDDYYFNILRSRNFYNEMLDICKYKKPMTEEQISRFEKRMEKFTENERGMLIIKGRFQDKKTYDVLSEELNISKELIRQLIHRILIHNLFKLGNHMEYILLGNTDEVMNKEYLKNTHLMSFDFGSIHINYALCRAGYTTVGELADAIKTSKSKVQKARNFGITSMKLVIEKLKEQGLLD